MSESFYEVNILEPGCVVNNKEGIFNAAKAITIAVTNFNMEDIAMVGWKRDFVDIVVLSMLAALPKLRRVSRPMVERWKLGLKKDLK